VITIILCLTVIRLPSSAISARFLTSVFRLLHDISPSNDARLSKLYLTIVRRLVNSIVVPVLAYNFEERGAGSL
jgi:hypothetical protein